MLIVGSLLTSPTSTADRHVSPRSSNEVYEFIAAGDNMYQSEEKQDNWKKALAKAMKEDAGARGTRIAAATAIVADPATATAVAQTQDKITPTASLSTGRAATPVAKTAPGLRNRSFLR